MAAHPQPAAQIGQQAAVLVVRMRHDHPSRWLSSSAASAPAPAPLRRGLPASGSAIARSPRAAGITGACAACLAAPASTRTWPGCNTGPPGPPTLAARSNSAVKEDHTSPSVYNPPSPERSIDSQVPLEPTCTRASPDSSPTATSGSISNAASACAPPCSSTCWR